MALPTRQSQRRALTASASRLTSRQDDSYSKRLSMHWQLRALEHVKLIGELNVASLFIARQISRCRFYPARLRDDGTTEPIESGPPVDIWNRIQDPGGGKTQLLYDYGRLMSITGEGVLFGYDLDSEVSRWKFLWREEVKRRESGEWVRLNADRQETNQVGVAYRFWMPSPVHSDMAYSPMESISMVAEELITLTASVNSTARTRMTKGIFLVPSEISPNPVEPLGTEDPENNILLQDYMEHTSSQIADPASVEAQIPFLFEGAAEYLPLVRWMATHDPQTDYLERELRTEAINRLALGLDMPPEALKGLGQVNHWGGKAIQLDMWRAHGVNKADQFAEGVASAILRPALEAGGYEGWERVVLDHDDSQVVISPDRTDDALKAHAQGIINGKAAREALGWSEEDGLKGEEKEEFFALKLREPLLLGDEMVLPARGPLPSTNGNRDASDGPPPPTGGRSGSRQEAMRASAQILGAAASALMRCRKLAGVRIRHKCKDCAEGHPESMVASILGPQVVTDPLKLVDGGTEDFENLLIEWGWDSVEARSLGQTLKVYAARTIFDPRQPELPAGFMAQVQKAEEVSRALVDSAA